MAGSKNVSGINSQALIYTLEMFNERVHADYVTVGDLDIHTRNVTIHASYPSDQRLSLLNEKQDLHDILLPLQSTVKLIELPQGVFDTTCEYAFIVPYQREDHLIRFICIFYEQESELLSELEEEISRFTEILHIMYASKTVDTNATHDNGRFATISQQISSQTEIQPIINVLAEMVFEDHISASSLLLYGPINQQSSQGPFNYVEVAGIWARGIGAGYGIGTRLYLEKDNPLFAILHKNGELNSFMNEVPLHFPKDALLRTLLKSDQARHWLLFPLQTSDRNFGMLFIGTNRDSGFSDEEHDLYRSINQLISVVVAAQVLHQEQMSSFYGQEILLNAVNDGILIAIPETNGALVSMTNKRFHQLFGYNDTVKGLKLNELLQNLQLPNSVRQNLLSTLHSTPFRDKTTHSGQFEMMNHEGHPVEIHWYSSPMYDPELDDVFARLYTFHDATPEQAALQVRSAFLSRVSHELRTPLTAINGFSQLILEEIGDELPDRAQEYITIIHDRAQDLKHIFSDLIEITRIYSGEIQLSAYPTSLPNLMKTVIQRFRNQFESRNQTIRIQFDDTLPEMFVDSERVARIMANLLSNAHLYTPEHGTVDIEIYATQMYEDLPEGAPKDIFLPAIIVSIINSGEGIPAEDCTAIFEPFYRGNYANINKINGAGLGLAVCRSQIDLHRGSIWAAPPTQEKPGGKIYFTIPL